MKTWTEFKTTVTSKVLPIQFEETSSIYHISAHELNIVYECLIYKGTVPTDGTDGFSITQVQNDLDKTEFETNYKPYANKSLVPRASTTLGYGTSTGSALTVIRATAYFEQTTNAQRSVLSSSASDTAAGIGARTITITYYDQTLLGPFTEIISLNGTAAVNTVATNICFIEKIEVTTVGNQLSNVGTITLKSATAGGGSTIGTIPAGDGITNWCHHYVGIGKIMNLISVIGTIKGQSNGALEVHRTIPTDVTRPELTIAPKIRIKSGRSDKLTFDVPIIITGPALVVVYGRSDASTRNLDWSVGIGYYE